MSVARILERCAADLDAEAKALRAFADRRWERGDKAGSDHRHREATGYARTAAAVRALATGDLATILDAVRAMSR